jgi:3-dehydroquinate dehydratase/shikimate dehydrogenase
MTLLAVPIMVDHAAQALALAAQAAEQGADLVELRLDRLADAPDGGAEAARDLVERCPLPCIVTCRPAWEGGEYEGDEQTRISLFEHVCLATHPPAYLDVELRAYQASANLRQKIGLIVDHGGETAVRKHDKRASATRLILSCHDFEGRPADLERAVMAMAEAPACRVIKLAWRARSLRDNLEAFELLDRRLKPTIALCMGEAGLPSRVLAKKFGALLTFAALDEGRGTAPGQPTLAQLKRLYRWDALQHRTPVFGVIGHPVGHSLSPHIHNAAFDATGADGSYLLMPIPPEYEHFKATVGSWLDHEPLHFRGASVTIPHKQNLLRFVAERGGEIEPLAATIGAANTLAVRDDGSLYAGNTDYAAALDSVCDGLGIGRAALAGRRVAVLGAGGAARAIVAGFADAGATVVIYNRTADKAEALAQAFGGDEAKVVAGPWDKRSGTCAEVIINCTPMGMHPNVEASPLDFAELDCVKRDRPPVVFDTIYNPIQTKLLRDATEAGCVTIPGTEMFVRQGAAQFELWTGQPAPLDVFRDVMERELQHH